MVLYLFFFHLFLILTGQTTYEVMKENEIDYLNFFKRERKQYIYESKKKILRVNHKYLPFDQGACNNILNVVKIGSRTTLLYKKKMGGSSFGKCNER